MNNLEINKEIRKDEVVLKCKGRLDAKWAGHLDEYIERLIRESYYQIILDMHDIEYISSAGIRLLVSQYKNLQKINGYLYITTMSENVREVLTMVGMTEMLSQPPAMENNSGEHVIQEERIETINFNLNFKSISPSDKTNINFYGQPERLLKSEFNESDIRLVNAQENHFAIGLGAIGQSYEACKNRFGEFLMLGKNIAYLPSDGTRKPDYLVNSGKLVASLVELYGIHFTGNFSHILQFKSNNHNSTITLSELCYEIQKQMKLCRYAIIAIAESGGLIATSLNASPVNGRKIFTYPEIRDTFNFTTEPAYHKMLTVSAGYITNTTTPYDENFVRQLHPDHEIRGHVHSIIFPYTPLKKTDINLNETIDNLFNNSELIDVVHLTNDTRDIVGLGESRFIQGFCWIAPINVIDNLELKIDN